MSTLTLGRAVDDRAESGSRRRARRRTPPVAVTSSRRVAGLVRRSRSRRSRESRSTRSGRMRGPSRAQLRSRSAGSRRTDPSFIGAGERDNSTCSRLPLRACRRRSPPVRSASACASRTTLRRRLSVLVRSPTAPGVHSSTSSSPYSVFDARRFELGQHGAGREPARRQQEAGVRDHAVVGPHGESLDVPAAHHRLARVGLGEQPGARMASATRESWVAVAT